ncbi:iron chelate uptake ABC transporter family permease subunit, partial [Rhodococcus erythropolis]|nr:iron chelate uptake ABC transporter family permease subunit [Rhodococcus erythropolis]
MSIDFGRPTTVVRSPKEGWSARIDVRTVTVCLILVALALAIGVIALGSGDYQVPIGDVLGALFGEAPARIHMVVVEWRLPRVLLALMLGAALGMSGAIFQSLTRNPLGSPDIIGFNSGAYTGALVVILLIGGTYYEIAVGALVGGIATAAV